MISLMWNSKQNKQTKEKQTPRYKLLIVREDGDRGMGEMGEEDWEIQTSSYKVSHKDIMYSTGKIVKNNVSGLYGDEW